MNLMQDIAVAVAFATGLPVGTALGASGLTKPASVPAASAEAVRLTLDTTRNKALERSINAALASIERQHVTQLCYALTGAVTKPVRPTYCQGPVDRQLRAGLVVVVLRNGAIVRLVSAGGASLERPMPMGSLAKMFLGVPTLALQGAKPDESWCRRAMPGLRNADGFEGVVHCDMPDAHRSATEALATSDNLAMIWRLNRIDPQVIEQQLAHADVTWPAGEVAPAVAMALGVVELSPRQVIECHEALVTGRARRATIVAGGRGEPTALARWCAQSVATPQRRAFVDTMLAAPLRPGGTASFLPAMADRAAWLTAKTGTPTTRDTLDSGKLLVFSARVRGARFTVFIGLASPRPNWPLARRLATSELQPLVAALLGDLSEPSVQRPRPAAPEERPSHRHNALRSPS